MSGRHAKSTSENVEEGNEMHSIGGLTVIRESIQLDNSAKIEPFQLTLCDLIFAIYKENANSVILREH